MKRIIIAFIGLFIVLCGCSRGVVQPSEISSVVKSSAGESSEEESSFWSNISGTFIDYVGSKYFNVFVEKYYQTDKTGDEFFVEFCKQFELTRKEILSVMYKENEIMTGMGDKAYYPESKMKEVMKILFGDENIELKEPVDVFTKTSGQYGLIFGDT